MFHVLHTCAHRDHTSAADMFEAYTHAEVIAYVAPEHKLPMPGFVRGLDPDEVILWSLMWKK